MSARRRRRRSDFFFFRARVASSGAFAGPNPAFILQHPTEKDVVYASTERIDEDGSVFSLRMSRDGDGVALRVVDEAPAKGKSTCYMAVDKSGKWLRLTNYWEASVCVLPIEGARIGACSHREKFVQALDQGAVPAAFEAWNELFIGKHQEISARPMHAEIICLNCVCLLFRLLFTLENM